MSDAWGDDVKKKGERGGGEVWGDNPLIAQMNGLQTLTYRQGSGWKY